MPELVTVATTDDLDPEGSLLVDVDGEDVALFEVEGEYYAIENTCSHSGGSLCDGMVVNTMVTCPLHGAAFDLASGEVLGPPADEPVRAYEVIVEDGDVKVTVDT